MKKSRKEILKRLLFSMMIIVVYLIGRSILLPMVRVNHVQMSQLLESVEMLTGSRLDSLSLFSLGFSPWMSTMIIWNLLSSYKRLNIEKLPAKVADRRKKYIQLFLGIIQALGILSTMTITPLVFFGQEQFLVTEGLLLLLLLTGTMIVSWLIDRNTSNGFGGSSLMVLVSMVIGMIERVGRIFHDNRMMEDWLLAFILVLALLFVIYVSVILDAAELRLTLNRIGLHNRFSKTSYVSLRLLPAGTMPIMFSYLLMSLPTYLLIFALRLWPQNVHLLWLRDHLDTTQLFGALVYIVVIFTLSITFSYVNIDIDKIVDNMREQGDYFDEVKPGLETKRFLKGQVSLLAKIGASIMTLLMGIPILYGVFHTEAAPIAALMGTIWMIVSLVITIYQQRELMKIREQYQSLF